jgi:hypothetical protein
MCIPETSYRRPANGYDKSRKQKSEDRSQENFLF